MFVLRPKPNDWVLAQMAGGRDPSSSPSWWVKGALVVDQYGPAVVDAEGRRVDVPVPPGGGVLVRVSTPRGSSAYGSSPGFVAYLVCDRDGRSIAQLPGIERDGFSAAEMKQFAQAAGFEFQDRFTAKFSKDFPRISGFINLHWCVHDDAYINKKRSRILKALWLAPSGEASPYRIGKTYPPMDPSYLNQHP